MMESLLLLFLLPFAGGLRCYTTKEATKSNSVECGLNTGCVKIYIDSEEMLMRKQKEYGVNFVGELPTLPEAYQNNPVLMRGCFILAVPDRCYNANNGLSYCWCSTKDLCNGAQRTARTSLVTLLSASAASVMLWRTAGGGWGVT